MASTRALMHTAGVYTRAKREMKFSERDFIEVAFSTMSRIFATVDSPNSFVVRMRRRPVMLMHPLTISFPGATSRGILSPVRAAVSRVDVPSVTIPSMGTRSPGFTRISVPIATSSGSTSTSSPFSSTLA